MTENEDAILLDKWTNAARRFSSTEKVVEVICLWFDLMKCLMDKDIEEIHSATEALKIMMNGISNTDEYKKSTGHRNLLYGMLESLHITVRAMIKKGRLSGCNDKLEGGNCIPTSTNGTSLVEVKEEIEGDWEQVENNAVLSVAGSVEDGEGRIKEEEAEESSSAQYEQHSGFEIMPSEEEVKMEEEIVKEEPLCPPLVDTIRVPMSTTTQRYQPYSVRDRHVPAGFRKATKQEYAKISLTPIVSPPSKPSTSQPIPIVEPAANFSLLNAEFAIRPCLLFSEDSKWTCKVCDKEIINDLEDIKEAHQTFECKDCGWKFCTKQQEHIAAHQIFECKDCQLRFCQKRSYNKHMKIHEIGKHRCIVAKCTMRFTNARTRDRHIKQEHKIKPYSCEFCVARFETPGAWEYHTFAKHEAQYKQKALSEDPSEKRTMITQEN